jgi:hypothetical protein
LNTLPRDIIITTIIIVIRQYFDVGERKWGEAGEGSIMRSLINFTLQILLG